MGKFESDSLFKITRDDLIARQVSREERPYPEPIFTGWRHEEHIYDSGFSHKVYVQDGDLYLYERHTGI